MTGVEIAEKLGINKVTIYNKLRKAGIKIRDNAEAQKFAYFRGRFNKKNLPKSFHHPYSTEEKVAEAYIIGAVMGDGHLSSNGVRLKVTQKDFRDKFARYIKKAYRLEPILRGGEGIFICDVHRVLVVKRIKKMMGDSRTIPNYIINGNKKVKANFIRGFADAEGCVDNTNHRHQIVITQNDEIILKKIQKLLLELGIQSKTYHKKNNPDQLVVSLYRNLKKYRELINFSIAYKRNKLTEMVRCLRKYTYDTNLYWDCLRVFGKKQMSFRALSRHQKVNWATIRTWVRGIEAPQQIKKDIEYGIIPDDYENLRDNFYFLPKVKRNHNFCKEVFKSFKI